jgi:hypothetical protein
MAIEGNSLQETAQHQLGKTGLFNHNPCQLKSIIWPS